MFNVIKEQLFTLNRNHFIIPWAKPEPALSKLGNGFNGIVTEHKVNREGVIKINPVSQLLFPVESSGVHTGELFQVNREASGDIPDSHHHTQRCTSGLFQKNERIYPVLDCQGL